MLVGYPLLHGKCMGGGRGWASQILLARQARPGVGLHTAYPQAGETGLGKNKKPQQANCLLWFLELLTRFELVTRFTPKTLRVFGDPGQLDMGDALAAPALSPKPPEGRGHLE